MHFHSQWHLPFEIWGIEIGTNIFASAPHSNRVRSIDWLDLDHIIQSFVNPNNVSVSAVNQIELTLWLLTIGWTKSPSLFGLIDFGYFISIDSIRKTSRSILSHLIFRTKNEQFGVKMKKVQNLFQFVAFGCVSMKI